jgi:hypothetical protein
MGRCLPIAVLLWSSVAGCAEASGQSSPGAAADQSFWTHWGDGKAEINGYTLQQPRYGELR